MGHCHIIDYTHSGQVIVQIELRQLRKSQRDDPVIGFRLRAVIDKCFPSKNFICNNEHLSMSRHFNKFVIKCGLLYNETGDKSQKMLQLVVPPCFRKQISDSLHNQIGHPGREKTISLVKDRFHWPSYTSDVNSWIEN